MGWKYHQDAEAAIDSNINLELDAFFVYLTLSYYLDLEELC